MEMMENQWRSCVRVGVVHVLIELERALAIRSLLRSNSIWRPVISTAASGISRPPIRFL